MHFDAKVNRRSGGGTTSPVRGVGQPGVGITPKLVDLAPGTHGELGDCDKYITPSCLRALYNLSYEPVSTERNSYGIGQWTSL